VYGDFEEYAGSPFYDLIVMNPPFSKGARFLLKAYDLLVGGGELICFLNAETIRNPCTKDRELLKSLIERVGETWFLEKAFSESKRKTDVKTAVVYLVSIHKSEISEQWGSKVRAPRLPYVGSVNFLS
jgi:hypothetical protein